jgi:transposase
MTKFHKQVDRLQKEGYTVSDIAEEMGISASRVQKLLDELEAGTDETSPATTREEKNKVRKLERTLEEIKEEFDELVLTLQELDSTTIRREQFDELLENTRSLEYKIRKVAKQYNLSAEESVHRHFLSNLVDELKNQRENFDEEEDTLYLDLEEDLLEEAEDLRFELFELMPLEGN